METAKRLTPLLDGLIEVFLTIKSGFWPLATGNSGILLATSLTGGICPRAGGTRCTSSPRRSPSLSTSAKRKAASARQFPRRVDSQHRFLDEAGLPLEIRPGRDLSRRGCSFCTTRSYRDNQLKEYSRFEGAPSLLICFRAMG